tara:strand:- start:79 stop:252 length:174 start_codon:yes stop_codon:yes gene_type:complete
MSKEIVVVITNFNITGTHSYAVTDRDNCHDEIDRMVFDLVIQFGDEVKMGQVVGYIL